MVSAGPAATMRLRRLRAALTSRWWTAPQAGQVQERTPSGLGPSRRPHAEQVWEVGAHRSILTTRRPCWAALSSSRRTNPAQPASWTLSASRVRANPAGEVFHGDDLVLADQPQGELVMMVGAAVADLAVGDRHPVASLGPVGRSLPLPGRAALRLGQAPLGGTQRPRVGNQLAGAVAGGDRREHGQAEVDPGRPG
jgi:hypothetical protein